ncbi:MAG: adenosylcobinamide-GDP ribazoletransferase [Nitrospirae bacterium]|nr:adenosylcobinamide-GDP ribazoletransferase [Nitrospirota bacterium]
MKRLMIALKFLTIIPLRKDMTVSVADIVKGIPLFPFVGLIQGILLVAMAVLSDMVLPSEITPAVVILVLVLLSGAFHLDGLSDTFDALAKRGVREEKLMVMKDGRTGPVGVTAIVLTLMMKYLALNALSEYSLYYFFILLMPVTSKWAMLIAMFHGKPAKDEGLGRLFIEGTGLRQLIPAFLSVFFIVTLPVISGAILTLPQSMTQMEKALILFIGVMAVLYITSLLSVRFYRNRFGGLTGDTLGAIGELGELIFLFMAVIWSRLYI